MAVWKLPGDMVIEKGRIKLIIPLGTSIALSVIATVTIYMLAAIRSFVR